MGIFKSKEEEESIAAFARCPNCNELISLKVVDNFIHFEIGNCPYCKITIEEEKVGEAYLKHKDLVKAMQSAGDVKGFHYAIPVLFAFVAFEFLLIYAIDIDDEVPFFKYIVFIISNLICWNGISASFNWLREFGVKNFQDEEFKKTKEEIKFLYKMWIVLFIINFILVVFLISLFN